MIARIPPVESVTAIGYVPGATVRRTAAVPAIDSGGISVYAAQPGLLGTLGGGVAEGTFLNAATARYPAVVLGAVAAQTLGIDQVQPGHPGVPGGPVLHRGRDPAARAARAGPGRGGAGRLSRRRHAARARRSPDPDLPARAAGPGAAGGERAPVHRQPGPAGSGAGQPAVEHPRGAGRGARGLRRALPWPRCRGCPGRRGGHRQHHGDLGPGAARGDRLAARPGRDPSARRTAVPDRVGPAVGPRRRRRVLAGAAATAGYAVASSQPAVVPAASITVGLGIALGTGALAGVYPAVRAARLALAEALRAS